MLEAQNQSYCKHHCKAPALTFLDRGVITASVNGMFLYLGLPPIITIISPILFCNFAKKCDALV